MIYKRLRLGGVLVLIGLLILILFLVVSNIFCDKHENQYKGSIVIIDKNVVFYDSQNINRQYTFDISPIKSNADNIITDVFWSKSNLFFIQKVRNGIHVDWYLINTSSDKIQKYHIYTGKNYSIYQVWNDKNTIVFNTSNGFYQLNLETADLIRLDLAADYSSIITNEYLVCNSWPAQNLFSNDRFYVDYLNVEIHNLFSRRLGIKGIVDNIAIVQVLPNTSNPELISTSGFLDSLKYGVNASTFSIFYFDLKQVKFVELGLKEKRKGYLNIKYINTDYDEQLLSHFQDVINSQANFIISR